jgi:hypothetical protein
MARRPHATTRFASVSEPFSGQVAAPTSDSEAEKPAVSAPSYEGQIAGISNGAIVGWAWDATRPYDPVEVELYAGDILVGRGNADIFDLELAKANRGNGLHRFELRLDRLPVTPPPFGIRAVIAGTEQELHPAITVAALDDAEALLSGAEYVGQLTGIESGMLCGWVQNRRNPHEQPTLTLRIDSSAAVTQRAIDQTTIAVDVGVKVNAFRFQLPLPPTLLDGKLHSLSVAVGSSEREISGSPILFGASDTTSIGRSLVLASERLERLERHLESAATASDATTYENRIISKILVRVDALLNVHRDAIEGELAVLRRQLTNIIQHIPTMDPDLIEPLTHVPAIEDIQLLPEVAFTTMGRSAPLMTYEIATHTSAARPTGGLKWLEPSGGMSITGSGGIELDKSVTAKVSIVLGGKGARDPAEFHGIVASFNGRPMSGRFDVGADGGWSFLGTPIEGAAEGFGRGLTIDYLSDISRPSGDLLLDQISIFALGGAPEHFSRAAPEHTILNLGTENMGPGWYPAEAGRRGGFCWMGEDAEIALNLRRTGYYQLLIPEIRPLSEEILPKMRIYLDGVPFEVKVSAVSGDTSTYRASAQCLAPSGGGRMLTLRISFPKGSVRSPMQLGLNNDLRPLSIAVRCLALSAAER